MNKEEYYKRIEKINNRFRTDRVSADEEYQLVCQRNYLSTKYIEHLEQQNKKYKEVIDKAIKFIDNYMYENYCYVGSEDRLKEILKEVSE